MKEAWDLGRMESEDGIMGRLKKFQEQLQKWNWIEFNNVIKMLKKKKKKLQQLELCDSLHGKTEEIKRVRREINKIQVREEIMWNQRSSALWLK